MDEAVVVALIAIVPQMLIAVVVVLAAVRFREPLSRLVDERVSRVSAFGFAVDLRPAEVDAAVQARVPDAAPSAGSAGIGSQVVDRATRLAPRLAGRTALWVDDHPRTTRLSGRCCARWASSSSR
jgi:hypothetical protein